MILTIKARNQNASVNSSKGSTRVQWIITILVNLTTLSYGLQIGWPVCVASVLQSNDSPTGSPLTALDVAWLASVPCLAAVLTIPIWTYIVDNFGRKPCLVIGAMCHFICWLITYLATNMVTLIIARLFSGSAGAFCLYIIALYVKEISQDDIRGAMGLVINTSRNVGVLLIYLIGGYIEYYTVLYIFLALTAVTVLIVLKAPESPTFYVKIGQLESAASTIATLRNLNIDDKVVQNEIDSIKAEDEKFKSIPNVTFIGIFKQKAWRKGFVCMTLIMICHGLNGGFAIINYAPSMLEMTRITVNPELQALSVPIVLIIGSFLSMLFIERLGRKPLLVASFVTSMVSFGGLAVVIMAQRGGGAVPEWVAVVLIAVPVFGLAAAISSLPFVIMAEMFNFQIRAKVMGVLVMLGWGTGFLQTVIFGQISAAFGPEVTFIFFAIINLAGTLVCLLLLPETKGKSVAEIEMELERSY